MLRNTESNHMLSILDIRHFAMCTLYWGFNVDIIRDLGDQSHLILGLDHHQPSPQTPFVSCVYFDKTKQGCPIADSGIHAV